MRRKCNPPKTLQPHGLKPKISLWSGNPCPKDFLIRATRILHETTAEDCYKIDSKGNNL